MSISIEIAKFIESVLARAGNLLRSLPWRDAIDVAFMSFLVYQVYVRIRGTRAMRILAGIVILGLAYLTAQTVGLFLTSWVLGGIWAATLILVIVIFQREIRHMLEQVNPSLPLTTLLGWGSQVQLQEQTLATVAQTAMTFAAKRHGALFVFERYDFIEPLLKTPGTLIDAQISEELLETIFTDPTPLHDGALYLRGGRAYRAGCVLPLSDDPQLAYFYGTRHRAALGITEQSDAVAVVVSEERGTVSVVEAGTINLVYSATDLLAWLTERLKPREATPKRPDSDSVIALITRNWRPKLATVVGVSLLLFVLVGQKNDERGISIPVVYVNIPKDLTIEDNRVQEVQVRVRGSRMMLDYFLDPSQLQVSIDLNKASAGFKRYSISAKDIKLPVGLQLAGINPAHIELHLRKKPGTPEGTG